MAEHVFTQYPNSNNIWYIDSGVAHSAQYQRLFVQTSQKSGSRDVTVYWWITTESTDGHKSPTYYCCAYNHTNTLKINDVTVASFGRSYTTTKNNKTVTVHNSWCDTGSYLDNYHDLGDWYETSGNWDGKGVGWRHFLGTKWKSGTFTKTAGNDGYIEFNVYGDFWWTAIQTSATTYEGIEEEKICNSSGGNAVFKQKVADPKTWYITIYSNNTYCFNEKTSYKSKTFPQIYGYYVQLEPPTTNHYTCTGYTENSNGSGTQWVTTGFYNPNRDVSLYCNWSPKKYKLTYDYIYTNNHSLSFEYNYNDRITTQKRIDYTGLTHVGWKNISIANGNTINVSTQIFLNMQVFSNFPTDANSNVCTMQAVYTHNIHYIHLMVPDSETSINTTYKKLRSIKVSSYDIVRGDFSYEPPTGYSCAGWSFVTTDSSGSVVLPTIRKPNESISWVSGNGELSSNSNKFYSNGDPYFPVTKNSNWVNNNKDLLFLPNNSGYTSNKKFMFDRDIYLYPIFVYKTSMYVYDGNVWKLAQPYVYDGNTWKIAMGYAFDDNKWLI